METTLRRYRPEDAGPTHEVFHAAVTGIAAGYYDAEQIAAWSPVAVDLERWNRARLAAWTVVAELAGRVVGFSDLTDDAVLDMLFVHPDAGGRGVARSLVTEVLSEARRRGMPLVETHASRAARPAFERLGFVVDAGNPGNTVRGVVVPNFDMHVDLAPGAGHD